MIIYRLQQQNKLTAQQLDDNFAHFDVSDLQGTSQFQFLFLDGGSTFSATFSFVNGILATHSTPTPYP